MAECACGLYGRVARLEEQAAEYQRYRQLVRWCLEGQALAIIDENVRLRAELRRLQAASRGEHRE